MKEDELTQSTNTAKNERLSFFRDSKLTKERQKFRKSTNLLKELPNDIFSVFNVNINNKCILLNVFNSLV